MRKVESRRFQLNLGHARGTTASLAFTAATTAGGTTTSTCNSGTTPVFPYPGASVEISQFTGGAILWALDNSRYFGNPQPAPSVLYAYDAIALGNPPLFSSNAGTANAIKFAVPTVANGKVYVGNAGQLVVFSLK